MLKKILMTVTLLAVTALVTGCGGGGSGNSSGPVGVNPNVPAIVQLLPVQYVAQTSSFITFKAKVLNGNGNVMQGVGVNFTKMSLLGVLSSTYAVTDTLGFATVTISSTTTGFTTLQAEVNTGTGFVRDKRTVLFVEGSINVSPFLTLDVDGDNDAVWNEASDFILFENTADNQVLIRATVYSSFGERVGGVSVTFGADTTSTDVTFPMGDTVTTDINGEAFVLVQANPSVVSQLTTVLNITASASNGAFNLVSLYLRPVTISTVALTANPTQVDSEGTSTISATVTTSFGTPAPDGTVIAFSATAGAIPGFAQTTGGMIDVDFTAPTTATDLTVTITGLAGGRTGTTTVNVIGVPPTPPTPPTPVALAVAPAAPMVNVLTLPQTITFTVSGGTAPYTAVLTAGDPAIVCNNVDTTITPGLVCDVNDTATWSGASFTATIDNGAVIGNTFDITVTDNVGAQVTATITIQ